MAKQKTQAEVLAELVQKEIDRSQKQSADYDSPEAILEESGHVRQTLLNIQKDALKKLKASDARHGQIKKLIAGEAKRLETLSSDIKKNEDFEKLIRTNIATSRAASERAAAEPDVFSQKTATLSATGQDLHVGSGELDSLIRTYAEQMASSVTQMRAIGLPAKEFAKKTLAILDGFGETIKKDAGLNVESDTAKEAKQKIEAILEEHKKNVTESGSLNPLALLGRHLAGGLREGIASTIKSIPGMGAVDKLAGVMGLKPISERIADTVTPGKSVLAREQETEGANIEFAGAQAIQQAQEVQSFSPNADTAARSARTEGAEKARATADILESQLGVLEDIKESVDESTKQDGEFEEDKARREDERDQDEAERRNAQSKQAKEQSRDSSGRFVKTPSSPVPKADDGDADADKGGGILETVAATIGGGISAILASTVGRLFGAKPTAVPGVAPGVVPGATPAAKPAAGGSRMGRLARTLKGGVGKYGGRAMKVGKGLLGRAAVPLAAGMDIHSRYSEGQSATQIGAGVAGGGLGAYGGALAGAAIGSAVPIVGTAIGGLVGGALGWYLGGKAADKVTGVGADVPPEADSQAMPTGAPAAVASTRGVMTPTKKMIMAHEGVRHTPYKDSLGLWTVGVGHLIGDGKTLPDSMNKRFSDDEVFTMFDEDYEHHAKAARKIPGYSKLRTPAQGALEDLTFNMGPSWYKKWPILTGQLSAGDTEGAARNLQGSKWYRQVGPGRGNKISGLIAADGGDGGASSMSPVLSANRESSFGDSGSVGGAAGRVVPLGAGGTANPFAATQAVGVPGVSRNGAGVAAATASHASQTAAAPTIVANIGGPAAPAAPSVTTMMPIPIPINARTEDMALRALQSANYSL